jgi:acyl-CoA dehydrogenase
MTAATLCRARLPDLASVACHVGDTPATVEWILDKAIQVHGAAGLSQDFPLAGMIAGAQILRIADGPDEVHRNALAKAELRRQAGR